MTIIIGADAQGYDLKNQIKSFLIKEGYQTKDISDLDKDFVDNTLTLVKAVQESEENLGIMIDAYGAGPFMVATKLKGMVAAEVSDERSAYMTRQHNNARVITIGSEIVGQKLAENIVKAFVSAQYDGGRHQIRVDMLNKMA
ncbi:galactose-6-phosphate isomerase subunit LacA [Streptococcus porcinus]|uniref:Galactose-6-phosphate isomerase subunit LacA n=1 Tax=Streptococcus porcinus TaxID=1340 RepID=A0A7W0AT09_STRPO|nr:galactose-6-phosphate isomerase subunit LacA [Streptococcus porcinus]MBA2796849.1 galactose-6-phosphate isomerase subunit LacA [Streptococcus porcinus]